MSVYTCVIHEKLSPELFLSMPRNKRTKNVIFTQKPITLFQTVLYTADRCDTIAQQHNRFQLRHTFILAIFSAGLTVIKLAINRHFLYCKNIKLLTT